MQESVREELSSMTLEQILKMKDELGAKVYNEAILGAKSAPKLPIAAVTTQNLKRLSKNCPREMFAKRQVPFLGDTLRKDAQKQERNIKDPRFDANAGEFNVKSFKQDYKFVVDIREHEIENMRKEISKCKDAARRKELKDKMQRLINKNVEERKWHKKQDKLKEEQQEIQRTLAANQRPHFLTKKERRVKDLVEQFEELKKSGKLNKHLEKRRKKNAAKDRKRFTELS